MSVTRFIARYSGKIIPETYRSDSSVLHSVYKWFFVGIFIRMVLMPIAFHWDLISTYHYSYFLLSEGSILELSPITFFQAGILLVFSKIIPMQELFFNTHYLDPTVYWLPILENAYIFRGIFLLKLLYLIFDILICLLILHIFKNESETGVRTFKFWILNPIVIFAVYIFGRFEVIPIFFILLCLYLAKENHIVLSALSLGIAIYSRYYALLLLPLFLILFCRNWTERVKVIFLILIPLLLFNVITYLSYGIADSMIFFRSIFMEYLLGMKVQIFESEIIFVFIATYFFILLYVWYGKKNENPLIDFTSYSLIIFLLFYATSKFHPQYFTWFIPFLAIYYGYTNEKSLVEIHCLQIICFTFYTFYWGAWLSTWLFASVNPIHLTSLPPPLQLIDLVYPGQTLLNIVRSAFSAVLLFMAWKIIQIQRRDPSSWNKS